MMLKILLGIAAACACVQLASSCACVPLMGCLSVCRLNVTQDVTLEDTWEKHNGLDWLIIGRSRNWPLKRSLVQMEDLPSSCTNVVWAELRLTFRYAHKYSQYSAAYAPWIDHLVQAYRVKRDWEEAGATSRYRREPHSITNKWDADYLTIGDPDTDAMLVGSNILKKDTPAYTVFSVPITPAVQAWKAGEPNYGLLLKVENEAFEGRGLRFYSNTVTDESLHAYITVVCST